MPAADFVIYPKFQAFDNNGDLAAGYKLFTYAPGLTTKQATFTTPAANVPNTNPVILDARGEANVCLDVTKLYKLVLAPPLDTDPPSSPVWTVDNVSAPAALRADLAADAGSSLVGFVAATGWLRRSVQTKLRELGINVNDYPGVDPTGVSECAAAIQLAIAAGARQFKGTYKIANVGTAAALKFAIAKARWDFDCTFDHIAPADRPGLQFGERGVALQTFDMVTSGRVRIERTFTNDGSLAASVALMGTGVLFANVGDMQDHCYWYSKGYARAFLWEADSSSCSNNKHDGGMLGDNCLIDGQFSVGADAASSLANIKILGLGNTYNPAFFSDSVGAFGIQSDGVARAPDNIKIFGGRLESRKQRKVQLERAEGFKFYDVYWDPGSYPVNPPYVNTDILTATLTAGSNLLTKAAHGITVVEGDKLQIIDASNAADEREVPVLFTGSDANNIAMDIVAQDNSAANVTAKYLQTNIYFGTNTTGCGIIGGAALSQNVIVDRGTHNYVDDESLGVSRHTADPSSFSPGAGVAIEKQGMFDYRAPYSSETNGFITNSHGTSGSPGLMLRANNADGATLNGAGIIANIVTRARAYLTTQLIFRTSNPTNGIRFHGGIDEDGTFMFDQGRSAERGSLRKWTYQNDTLADDGAVDLPDATDGFVIASCNGEAGIWNVRADGSVNKIAGSANTVATDTDTNLCVFDNGTKATVKNRLGAVGVIRISYEHN